MRPGQSLPNDAPQVLHEQQHGGPMRWGARCLSRSPLSTSSTNRNPFTRVLRSIIAATSVAVPVVL